MPTAATLMLIGRVVFGLFFLIAGIRNFAGFAERVKTSGTNYGWKLPAAFLVLGFAIQVFAGLALILNIQVIPAVVALLVFLVLATALFHNPLTFPHGGRDLHIYLVLVNATLAGGLLLVAADAL